MQIEVNGMKTTSIFATFK